MSKGFFKNGGLALLLILLSGQVLYAATKHHRVVWDVSPASQAVIAFSPDGTSTSPSIEYGFTTDETSWASLSGLSQQTFAGTMVSYFGRLSGLPADSPVYYRVCDQDGCGQRFWFKTAPGAGNNTPFVVVAGGDTRTGWDTRRQGNVLISKIRPLFIMHGGDYTNDNGASEMDQLLTDWVLTYSDDTIDGHAYKRIYPIVPTHGNHENNEYNTLCKVFGVDYNQNGSCETSDTYDTYGATHVSSLLRVYTLNSEFRDWGTSHFGNMNSWLSSDLAANGSTATWRFAQYHKPMFPHYTGKSENPDLFAEWSDDFYNHAMNLVVESDTHMMKMTESLEPSGSTFINQADGANSGGTVFVGEGSWGAPARSADDPKSWTIDLASIQQIKVIVVHPDRLEVRTALFDDTATTLTREERAADPVRLPQSVNWWDNNGIGEVLDLKRHAITERSIIDEDAEFTQSCDQSLCEFTDLSIPGGGTIKSWSWDFGDGTIAGTEHPRHGYDADGKYNVTLRVTDDADNIHVYGKSVTVAKGGTYVKDIRINNGSDDVEERLDNSDMYMTSSDLELINDGGRDQAVGLRFSDIGASQGATVNAAYIQFTAKDSESQGADLEIRAQTADNAGAFTTATNNLSSRSMTDPVAWDNIPAWSGGNWYETPNLATIVQQVVDRGGWSSGNSMVFKVTGDPGDYRRAYSYDDSPANAPILNINYGADVDLSIPITASIDDVEESESGSMSRTSSDLELIFDSYDNRNNQKVGLRFTIPAVPQGVTINSASISFKAENSTSYGADLSIQAQDVDDGAQFVDETGNLTNRTQWTSAVDWGNLVNWTTSSTYDTPDLSSIVQDVFDRPGWSPNSSLVFKVTGSSGDLRRAWAHDGSSSAAALLHIEYSGQVTPCAANRTIPGDDWVPFALPCDPGDANTVEDVFVGFAGLDAVKYGVRWILYRFNPVTQSNEVMALTDRMYPGQGYWVKTLDGPITVTYTGVVNMTGDLGLEADSVHGEWNFVGFTENAVKSWAEFKAYNGSTLVSVSTAGAGCDLNPPGDQCLISRTGYVWNGSNYDPYNAVTPGLFVNIEPGHAVWVKAFKPDTMLRIESPTASAPAAYAEATPALKSDSSSGKLTTKGANNSKKENDGWFIRLIAESGSMRDRSNALGQLPNSVDGLDSNDIEELTPYGYGGGSKYLSLTFEHEEFRDADWGYTSDYRAMAEKPEGVWLFQVRASNDAQEITLRWEGDDKLLRSARLRDEQTGEIIRIRPGETYRFKNSEGGNWFTWVMKDKVK